MNALDDFINGENGQAESCFMDIYGKKPNPVASCIICGIEKELSIWLDPSIIKDRTFHGVCYECRSATIKLESLRKERDDWKADAERLDSVLELIRCDGGIDLYNLYSVVEKVQKAHEELLRLNNV